METGREPCVVPEGEVLTLSDNRDGSVDSRFWGFVQAANLRAGPRWILSAREDPAARRFTDPQREVSLPPTLRAAWDACRARLR